MEKKKKKKTRKTVKNTTTKSVTTEVVVTETAKAKKERLTSLQKELMPLVTAIILDYHTHNISEITKLVNDYVIPATGEKRYEKARWETIKKVYELIIEGWCKNPLGGAANLDTKRMARVELLKRMLGVLAERMKKAKIWVEWISYSKHALEIIKELNKIEGLYVLPSTNITINNNTQQSAFVIGCAADLITMLESAMKENEHEQRTNDVGSLALPR